jgi:glycosyltransferase involved in cell wall biosynthesis
MRIEIDATSLLLRSAGVKNYTFHWIDHLRRAAAPGDSVGAFPFLGDLGRLNHDRSNIGAPGTLWRLAALYGVNLLSVPRIDWITKGASLFHASNQVRRPPVRTPMTATVHDLTCWILPELHTPANVRADASFAEHVWKRCRGLIAVSENSRLDAIRLLGIKPEAITTIYSGIAAEFFDARPAPSPRPYVLFVGTIEPRKNVDLLLSAYQSLRVDLRNQFDLVIAGPGGWNSEQTMVRLRSGLPGVRYRGYVDEGELPGLTAGATLFAYPSLYEGFGFPVAQAMAAGVPVLTSNTSCLPEVAGGGALFADPRSESEVAAALTRLLENPTLRKQLGRAGRERAEQYRWETCAQRSWEFFRNVATA